MKIKAKLTILLSVVAFSILLSCVPKTESASAYSASITTSDSITLDVSPTGDGTSIKSESINVASDCRAGYNFAIATSGSSNLYKDGDTSNGVSFTAVDGSSALNGSNNTNKWGYSVAANPTSSTIFSPLSTTQVILKTSSQTASPSSDIDDTFSINYGVKVDNNVSSGAYQMANNDSIVYYLTMDATCTQYTVVFHPNGGTVNGGGSNPTQNLQVSEPARLLSSESIKAPTTSTYIDADNNTITGNPDKLWAFWGWNTSADGTGDWYKDRELIEDLGQVGDTIVLYAQWKQATLADMVAAPTPSPSDPKQINHDEMQDILAEVCYNSPITTAANAPAATLLDYRGKVVTGSNPESAEQYTVSKLADGLCWMTKNLNLGRASGGPNGDGTITLTPDDTDLDADTSFILPASTTTSNTTNTAATIRTTNNSGNNNDGTYYSWASAVASTNSTNAAPSTSICPRNWDLPVTNQYTNLATLSSYDSSNLTTSAPSTFLVSGGFTNGATFYRTSYSHYWTSTSSTSNIAYGAIVDSTTLTTSASSGTTYGGNKYYRKNIRCVVSLGKATINYEGNGTTEYPVTGSVASQENIEIASAKAQPGTGFTRGNWTFNNWNTAPDGSGITIAADSSLGVLNVKPGGTITLYAQWLPTYTITYVNNCMAYASANSSCTQSASNITSDQSITLVNTPSVGTETGTLASYNKWTLTGWKIKGWSVAADNSDGTNTEYAINSIFTVPSGSDVGSGITLYAHWTPVYTIQYDGNGADNLNGMGTTDVSTNLKSVKQINVGEGDSVTLLPSNFKHAKFGFVGWSIDQDAWAHFTDNDSTNDPIIYGPMETIEAPAYPTNGTNILTMYAVWVPAKKDGSNNPVYLQDFSIAECNNLTSVGYDSNTGKITATKNSIIALTDKRDNEVYTIAKLADDNCWMLENLRLEHEGTVGNNTNDSTITNESLSQGYGGASGTYGILYGFTFDAYGHFVGLAKSESTNFGLAELAASNSIYKSSANPPVDTYDPSINRLEDIGTQYEAAYRIPRYNNSNTKDSVDSITYTQDYANAKNPIDSGTNYRRQSNIYSFGNYYTWTAALANTNYFTDDGSVARPTDAGTSICPTGWTLPGNSKYSQLSKQYGGTGGNQGSAESGDIMSNRFRAFPNNYISAGYFQGQGRANSGYSGDYWTKLMRNSSYFSIVRFGFDPNSLSITGTQPANYGLSIRCVMEDTYVIRYNGNNATGGNMISENVFGEIAELKHNVREGDSILLYPPNFYKTGYGFVGWSTDPDAWSHFTDNDNTNDPTIYGPQETIIAPPRPGTFMTLYAVWIETDPAKTMQTFDATACHAMPQVTFNSTTGEITVPSGSVIALRDQRDNNVYTVARLVDGKCWMSENLRLNSESTVGYNQTDPSVTNESLSQGYGGQFVGLATSEYFSFSTNRSTPNSLYSTDGSGGTINLGTNSLSTRFPRYNNSNTNTSLAASSERSNSADTQYSWYSYGNYYNWAAAIANTSRTSSSSSGSINTSICPANWTLPTNGSTSTNYGTLFQLYGGGTDGGDILSNRFRSFPNNYLYATGKHGIRGEYWSKTAHIFDLQPRMSGSYVNQGYETGGNSVRCLVAGS